MAINREKYSPVIGIEQEFDEWIEKFRVKKETQRGRERFALRFY